MIKLSVEELHCSPAALQVYWNSVFILPTFISIVGSTSKERGLQCVCLYQQWWLTSIWSTLRTLHWNVCHCDLGYGRGMWMTHAWIIKYGAIKEFHRHINSICPAIQLQQSWRMMMFYHSWTPVYSGRGMAISASVFTGSQHTKSLPPFWITSPRTPETRTCQVPFWQSWKVHFKWQEIERREEATAQGAEC